MSFPRPGAIDLSALGRPAAGPAAPGGSAPTGASWVVEGTDQTFQTVALEASAEHVVVLSLWSPRAPQAGEFNDRLAAAANSLGGRLLLVLVDIDANPQIARALGVQSVPFVVGLVQGQPVPLFQSTVEDEQIRAMFEELVRLGAQHGVSGTAQPVQGGAPEPADEEEPEQDDPRFAAADEAFASNDLPAAIAEYEKLLAQYPADLEIQERLAGTRLMSRVQGADLAAARAAAADQPDDIEAQFLVADLDISGGHVDDAFGRLLELVRRTGGDDRETVRARLLELFTVVGVTDPRVATARRALATALF